MTKDALALHLKKVKKQENLDTNQAESLADAFLGGTLKQTDMKDVLTALKKKGETVDEIVGFAQSLRKHAVTLELTVDVVDTCGTGGDGARTFNISTASALLVAGCGVHVAKHGNKSNSGVSGSADVLAQLGADLNASPEATKSAIERHGFGFLFAPAYHPAMKNVASVRKAMGGRTIFNLLGPLCNPAKPAFQVIGVPDLAIQDKMAQACRQLGIRRALVVTNENGLDEAAFGKTRVLDATISGVQEFTVDTRTYGITGTLDDIRVENVEQSAARVENALKGIGVGGQLVALNAALALYAAGVANTVEDGFKSAQKAQAEGTATAVLERFVKESGP